MRRASRRLRSESTEDVVTAADQLRAQGAARALRETLTDLLREKFTSLPVEVEERIDAAGASELEAWTMRVLKATSLDEVFAAG